MALACRERPLGLNIAPTVFEGRSELVMADDLRFSRAEIAEFFDQTLSRRELAAVAADSAGWPMALRIRRNAGSRRGTGEARVMREVVENWVESRLWHDLSEADREFVLDVRLFEWVDGETERTWRDGALPDSDDGCLDLRGQSWREMEALACARLRLLAGAGRFAARRFAGEPAGNRRAARERLAEFLRLFAETDYARSLVRHREAAAALALLDATRTPETAGLPRLSVRERDVLARLDRRDREIAGTFGLSHDGVRYHVRRLFRKLEVHSRREAVRRARELGIMPERS